MKRKRQPLPRVPPAPPYTPPPRPAPSNISREAALEGHARRIAEYASLGTERGRDVAAQSRAAADIANGRRGGGR